MGPTETRVLAVERRVGPLAASLEQARRRLVALLQGLNGLDDLGDGSFCRRTWAITVKANTGGVPLPIPGVLVAWSGARGGSAVTDSSGLATVTTYDDGNHFFTFSRDRLATTTQSVSGQACGGGPYALAQAMDAASGYHFAPGFALPLSDSLLLNDGGTGRTVPIAWSSGDTWAGSDTWNYPGCGGGGCPARTGLPLSYAVDFGAFNTGSGRNAQVAYPIAAGPGACPDPSGAGGTGGFEWLTFAFTGGPGLGFLATITDAGTSPLYCGAAPTLTVAEA